MSQKFKILSIDGGGIRGIIPAQVLADLENRLAQEHPGTKLYQHFDLICGTSTGSILGIAVALGVPPSDLVQFYKDYAREIFPKWYLKVIPRSGRAVVTSIYSNKKLRKRLEEVFKKANEGKVPLLDDLKAKVCIPTFNGNTGEINVLKTRHHEDYNRDYKMPAHEVALSSSSAPIYFPPHSFSYSHEKGSGTNVNMVDGGIFANNPALIGLLEATEKLGKDFSEISLLSLGTGKGKHIIKKTWKQKDLWYWLFPKPRLLDIIFDSQAQITEQYLIFLERILASKNNGFSYLRIQHDFGNDPIDLNASTKADLNRLSSVGEELSKKNLKEIINFLKK